MWDIFVHVKGDPYFITFWGAKRSKIGQGCQENPEALGEKRQLRPPVSEVSRKFSGSRN